MLKAEGGGLLGADWHAQVAATALDRLPTVDAVRWEPGDSWCTYVDAGPLRFSVADDIRDGIAFAEVGGLADPVAARDAFPRVVGVSLQVKDSGTWLDEGPVLSVQLGPDSVIGHDRMIEVARLFSVVGAHAGVTSVPQTDPRRGGPDGAMALVRAAGRAFRPWRFLPPLDVLWTQTRHGRLIAYASVGTGVPWLARLDSAGEPPAGGSLGLRWVPALHGTRREFFVITWREPTTTAWGGRVPALSEVIAVLDR